MTVACMGGWCRRRNNCTNYKTDDRSEPAERLCIPGEDGKGMDTPVVIHMPVGSWERKLEAVE